MTSRQRRWLALSCLTVALGLSRAGAQAEPAALAAFVSIDGAIDALTETSVENRVRRALEKNPRFLVVSISSGGGEVEASRNIAWNLHNLEDVTVVAWVRGHALSGATFVAFGCDLIAMRPGGQLGDALPIRIDQLGMLPPAIAEKMISPLRKDLRTWAEQHGYPLDVADAMVDPAVELHRIEVKDARTGRLRPEWHSKESLDALPYEHKERIGEDRIIDAGDQLLVINPDDALDMGIARFIADDEGALLRSLATEFSLPEVAALAEEGLWWEKVVRFLDLFPVKALLFIIGVIALITAFAHPGQGWPEVTAALCLGAVFFSSYLLGLADHVEATLFVIGAVLLGIELFTPGFGVLGIAGIALLGIAFLLSFQKFILPHTPDEWSMFERNIGKTVLAGFGGLVGLAVLMRFAPRLFILRRLALEETLPSTMEPTAAQELAPVGTGCEATTTLRPVGKVRVGQDVFDAYAEEGFVPAGQAVVVVGHRAGQLVVAARPETTTAPRPEAPA
jgi:membrane-bound serine protease (ClpP class)